MTKLRIVCALPCTLLLAAVAYGAPVRLRCESLQNPVGVDSAKPHFSWQSDNSERNWQQSAYQILVASSAEQLNAGHADVWDSGKIASAESVGIVYVPPEKLRNPQKPSGGRPASLIKTTGKPSGSPGPTPKQPPIALASAGSG